MLNSFLSSLLCPTLRVHNLKSPQETNHPFKSSRGFHQNRLCRVVVCMSHLFDGCCVLDVLKINGLRDQMQIFDYYVYVLLYLDILCQTSHPVFRGALCSIM